MIQCQNSALGFYSMFQAHSSWVLVQVELGFAGSEQPKPLCSLQVTLQKKKCTITDQFFCQELKTVAWLGQGSFLSPFLQTEL